MTQDTTNTQDRTVLVPRGDTWVEATEVPDQGLAWVVLASPREVRAEAAARGVSAQALRVLDDQLETTQGSDDSGRHLRGRVNRTSDDEIVLSLPTVSFVEASRDVLTGVLTCVVAQNCVIACESGHARVLARACDKLSSGLPVPDEGVRQVLAAILLTLVNRASDVEAGLGDAVAEIEQLVFAPRPSGADLLGVIYGLKREIAEARRALGPMASALPEIEAETHEVERRGPGWRGNRQRSTYSWLRRVRDRSDRLDARLDAHDDLLDAMLSVYLSQVSVRQNEDMRKISAWAAMITVPTLIAGIYGMNFRYMPELDWRFGYPLAVAVMAGACALLYRAFRRSGWL